MLDINFIRKNPEEVKEGVVKKGYNPELVERVLELDKKRVELLQKVDKFRQERNEVSKSRTPGNEKRGAEVKEALKNLESQLKKIADEYELALQEIPNLPADDVSVGKDESENKVLRKWGEPNSQFKSKFKIRDHLELGQLLGIIDVQRASKVSGTRFGYLLGDAALLEFALVRFAFDTLVKEKFNPLIPPSLIKEEIMQKLGYMEHGGRGEMYILEKDGLALVATAEHSMLPYFAGETLDELPARLVGFSSSFRREAGSYGKDTKGIFRVHQFDKVEMVSFTKPEESEKEHQYLLSLEENFFQSLEIPYQVVAMCTGDLGHPTARKYDIEAWIPSEGRYREVTSTSDTTDYQARRLNIKYRKGGETEFVHMLNGTALAIGRTIIAILENFQQKDGSVVIPKVLRPYMGKDKITPAA